RFEMLASRRRSCQSRRATGSSTVHYNAAAMDVSAPCDSILDTIGSTPLVRIRRMGTDPGVVIHAKVEGFNPMGSVKERIALRIVEEAERRGELRPDAHERRAPEDRK